MSDGWTPPADLLSWRRDAACAGMDTNAWFVESPNRVSEATRAVCASCIVQSECLTEAMQAGYFGYWAGTTERERRRKRQSAFRARAEGRKSA